MISSTLQIQENRERLRKTATVVKLHYKTDKNVEKRIGGEF